MIFISLLVPFAFLALIILGISSLIRRRSASRRPAVASAFRSGDDLRLQYFGILAAGFLGMALLSFDRKLPDPFSWQAILLFVSALTLGTALYFRILLPTLVGVVGLAIWWAAEAVEWAQAPAQGVIQGYSVVAGFALIFLTVFSLGRLLSPHLSTKRLGTAFVALSAPPILLGLFVFSTKSGLSGLQDLLGGEGISSSWQLTASIIILSIAAILALAVALLRKAVLAFEAAGIGIVTLLVIGLTFAANAVFIEPSANYWSSASGALTASGLLVALVINVVLLIPLLMLIFSGYKRGSSGLVTLGTLMIFLFILVKFADVFFTFNQKSVFFVVSGVIILGLGYAMERGRQKLLRSMKGRGVPDIPLPPSGTNVQ